MVIHTLAHRPVLEFSSELHEVAEHLWVVKKLSDLEMSELRRIKDSTVLPLNLAVKTLLLT
jgi:hypothetical protein